jgi:hypothetical protein
MSAAKNDGRLRPGELDGLVLTYMREHKDDGPLTASAIGRGIGRSSGAVANCLVRLVKAKKIRQAKRRAACLCDQRSEGRVGQSPLPFLEGRGAGHREVRRSLVQTSQVPSPPASALEKRQWCQGLTRSRVSFDASRPGLRRSRGSRIARPGPLPQAALRSLPCQPGSCKLDRATDRGHAWMDG